MQHRGRWLHRCRLQRHDTTTSWSHGRQCNSRPLGAVCVHVCTRMQAQGQRASTLQDGGGGRASQADAPRRVEHGGGVLRGWASACACGGGGLHSTRRSQKSVPKLERAARGNCAVRRVACASSTFHQTPSQQMNAHQWAPSPQTARAIRNVTRRVEGVAGAGAGRVRQWADTPRAARDDAKGRTTAP